MTQVTLTTRPEPFEEVPIITFTGEVAYVIADRLVHVPQQATLREQLPARWPGVVFKLPPGNYADE